MIQDFVIPVNKDELLQTKHGQYFVQNIFPIHVLPQALDEARSALNASGIDFIVEHFDTFFSVIVHGSKMEMVITMRAFNRIHKAIEILINDMEAIFDKRDELDEVDRHRFFNITKMLVYLFSSFICYIENEIFKDANDKQLVGKRKKVTKSDLEAEWEVTSEKALEHIYRLLQLPLQKLWQPPIVEDAFILLLTKICYKHLEQCGNVKQKNIRQTIFEILGTSIKKYNHGMSCVIRIIQLVKVHDGLSTQIAAGVIHMVTNCGCSGLIKEIMKEIDQSKPTEVDSRNISIFLETLAATNSSLIIPILDDIMDYLGSEYYTMRNCTMCVIREVVQKALTGDELTQEQKGKRDQCLNALVEHILDVNAYVRSKVLQVWQSLCCEGAIPVKRQVGLLTATVLRLEDKSANVRKQALQLIRALLQVNPFAAKLNKAEISKSLEKEEIELRNLQTENVSRSARGDNARLELWNSLLPEIRKALKEVISNGKKNRDQNDQDEDENVDENINPDSAFEHIRQLMLEENVLKAVKLLWNICKTLKQTPDVESLSSEAKEECLFTLLLKTFMESENDTNNAGENAETSQSVDKRKQTEEIKAKKRVVYYLRNCLKFTTELENAVPLAEKLLFSTTASDAVEACTFLGVAHQFGVAGATDAIHHALFQVFHRDQSVQNNVAEVYRDIYLNKIDNKKSDRQNAFTCVKALIELLKGLQPGQSQALTELILTWYKNNDINSEVLQVLWEIFSMKLTDTSVLDSRCSLMLITMIAKGEGNIITSNLEVLIKVGFGPQAKTNLLLARDTCRALLAIRHKNNDINTQSIRYANDHEIFKEILTLLIENFMGPEENGYVSFATDAISATYHLADQPDRLMKQLLSEVCSRGKFNEDSSEHTFPLFLLSRLLYLIGHIAIKQMVHMDTSVYKELKRRDAIKQSKKNKNTNQNKDMNTSRRTSQSSNTPISARQMLRNKDNAMEDNGEEAVEGAVEDPDAEFITDTLENHVVTGDGLLVKYVPLVLDVCYYRDKYNNEDIQAAGALALSKMMTVSSYFCEQHLQLLITILERSPYPAIRAAMLIGISDLTTRFPNETEPWMKHVYGRLRDNDTNVRSTCVRVLSSLVMREMVRVRGQISELALCIVDKDPQIRQDTKQFFKTLSRKGNALYNVMPDILSRLTDPEFDINESDFQEVLKYLLNLLQKETQIDAIIEKICARFQMATTERQWRDFAFCLSLLQFSAKSIRRLTDSLPLLKEKIHHKQVLKALHAVIDQTKKKPNAKPACLELEEKIEQLLKGSKDDSNQNDNEIMPPPSAPRGRKRSKTVQRKSSNSSSSSSSSSNEEEENNSDSEQSASAETNTSRRSRLRERNSSCDSDSTNIRIKIPRKERKIETPSSHKIKSNQRKANGSVTGIRIQVPIRRSSRVSQGRISK